MGLLAIKGELLNLVKRFTIPMNSFGVHTAPLNDRPRELYYKII